MAGVSSSVMRRILSASAALLCAVLICVPSASAARQLALGFDTWAGAERSSDLGHAAKDGASIVRVNVEWAQVNPSRKSYNWSAVDQAVRLASARGLEVALTIYDAPTWAEGAGRPSSVGPGSWRVNAKDFGRFASVAARRYDGKFKVGHGKALPRVRFWQVWNEPNLDYYLSPQWVKGKNGKFAPVAPVIYRSMVNAFYKAVKHVSASNRVIMAGTAPYGDSPGTDPLGRERTPPVAFDRDLFCLSTSLKPACSAKVHLDGIDHHPYAAPSDGPTWHATNKDDVAVPDMYKLVRVLHAGVGDGHVLPHGKKSVWASEVGWTSNPPTSGGVPLAKDAHWYEQAFYILSKQGVDTAMVTEIRDQPSNPNVFQDGLYFINGHPKKPLVTAYRFPFVTQRQKGSKVQAWGRAPSAGKLEIQVQRGAHWKTLRTLKVHKNRVFSTSITLKGGATLRATIGKQTSLTWAQGA